MTVHWYTDKDNFKYAHNLNPGSSAVWPFGLLNAWRACSQSGIFKQGITFTLWGARRRARRWAERI